MKKAIFISGYGTAYRCSDFSVCENEIYPDTLPALRFLARRGFMLVLVTPDRQEYKWFKRYLRNKTLNLMHCFCEVKNILDFIEEYSIDLEKSYYISDGLYLKRFQDINCNKILVLSGRGVNTLGQFNAENLREFTDICRDIYSAAFSVALNNSSFIV